MLPVFSHHWSREKDDPAWDDFVASLPDGHYEQSTSWARVREIHGWQSLRLKTLKEGKIIAGVQLLYRRVPLIGRVCYAPYGPCFATEDRELMHEVTGEIIRKARADLKGYVVFNLPYFRQSLVPVLEKNRFRPSIQGLPPHILITSTLLIDLFQSPEEIMAGMKAKARQNIRHGIRGGLQMREGNREDIDTFYRLMTATCDRRQAQPLFQDIGYFYHIWDHFCKNQQVRIFIVSLADEPVCAAFAFPFGNILYMWQFGWSGRYGNLNPSSVLVWNTIEWAREKGFRYYDFVSVDTEISRVIASGQPVNERLQAKYFYGPTLHKMSFGGLLIHLPGTYAYFSNKAVRWFAYNVLILMLKQHWFMNALHGFWAKIKRNSPRISNE